VSDLNLPSGWTAAELQDVATWSSGGTPSRSNPEYYSGPIPWLKTGELGPRIIREAEEHISEAALDASSAKVFPRNSVAIAMYGATIGKTSILGIDAATNQACAVGIPDATNSEFLYYFLVSQEKGFIDAGKGGAQPNISQGIVKSWPISLPPRAEQTRIVAKLEELLTDLDAGVAELKAAQKKLAQYRQSLLKAAVEGSLTAEWRAKHKPIETGAQLLERILTERRARWEAKQLAKFAEQGKTPPKDWQKKYPEPVQPDTTDLPELPKGWVWPTVDQLSEVVSGFAYKSTDFCSTGIPVSKIANIGYGVYQPDDSQEFLPSNFLKETPDFVVSGMDILIALTRPITNGTLKSCFYPEHLPRSLLNQRVAAIKTVLPNTADYIFLISRTPYFREKVRSSTSETLQPNMSPNALKAIAIPLPPISEAAKLVELTQIQLSQIVQQEEAINISLKQSTAQRQNILRAAFAGQLVAQDPNDEPASALLERIRAERAARDAVKKPRARKLREMIDA
jgi:type I restriction enzyme, S subunit